jgi:type II secretory pathway pseudopilin PulG
MANGHIPHSKRGFTLVEMLIIAPIVILVIGIFVSAIITMTGDVLAVRGKNALAFNIQDALNRIDQDVKSSGGYLATNNITLTSPQGYDDNTAVFKNADATNGTMLILNTYATTANPLSSTRNFVYTTSPNACNSALVSQNQKVAMNVVYFIKNNALWRRVIAPSNYATVGCSVPWQQPTCTPGYVASFCKTQDMKLVDGVSVSGFALNYYTSAAATTPIANAVNNTLSNTDRRPCKLQVR